MIKKELRVLVKNILWLAFSYVVVSLSGREVPEIVVDTLFLVAIALFGGRILLAIMRILSIIRAK